MHAHCLWMDSWLRKQWYGQGDLAVSRALLRATSELSCNVVAKIKNQGYLF